MKRFCLVLLSIILLSCSNDDDNSVPTLQGTWNLVNVSGGITGLDEDIDRGAVVWDFDITSGMVTIVNNSTTTSANTLLVSGTYTYSVSDAADANILAVNEVDYGRLNLENTVFTITESAIDGFTFRFER
ncbi:hypothetical protein [uncultured Aquimarina sp.]|uniref:hypothetical protein n=1 Tax=uncultured Aquimarina sp. TaxID=575652 RepID=UPI00261116B3|nr:hypothetical protein [uncultured Aquimarina sp.]